MGRWNVNVVEPIRLELQECIVYLEAYEKAGDGIVDAFVDFRQTKDFVLFRSATGYGNMKASFIEFRSLKASKRLRRGCYYKLNLDLLKNFQIERQENSLLIGGAYDLSNMQKPETDDDEVLQKHEALDAEEMSIANVPPGNLFDNITTNDLKLFVKDVGQANWNELRIGDDVKVVYDAGAELHAHEQEVRQIFGSRKNDLMRTKPVLVISHWDMDHIHCLKVMNDNDIRNCFSRIVCPDKVKSMTSQSILENFRRALGNASVFSLPLPARTNGVAMHLWRKEGCISLYRAEASSQINYCGLVMFVRGNERSACYTGDCRLVQAKDAYEQEKDGGLTTNAHVLIAPHHGGDCGVNYRRYSDPCNVIAISVRYNNGFGHPQGDMMKYLKLLGTVKQTKDVGDIIEIL
jgi:beta-lactamase superfamily II metal-dependent hydrolase